MFIRLKSISTIGVNIYEVSIEVNIFARGMPYFDIVGLPDKAVSESKHRVKTAIINSGFEFPNKRILVNLAPANMPKQGSVYDFAIAAGILACSSQNYDLTQFKKVLPDSVLYGELSLDGSLRYVPGAPLLSVFAKENNISNILVPSDCACELAGQQQKPQYNLYAVSNLGQLKDIQTTLITKNSVEVCSDTVITTKPSVDLAHIVGNKTAKRALEISAAGSHNLLFLGSPGVGKTTLALAYKSILAPLTPDAVVDVHKITAISNIYSRGRSTLSISSDIPFRQPHHTVSLINFIGGGVSIRPGEITLAHKGVLFLDELQAFSKTCIDALRQPLESGFITLIRGGISYILPCECTLLATSNPCPCGYFGHPDNKCTCTPAQLRQFMKKISGPILDRIDIVQTIHKPISAGTSEENSQLVFRRVCAARKIQEERFAAGLFKTNSRITPEDVERYCVLTSSAKKYLDIYTGTLNISLRRYFKILKLARTIADLASIDVIKDEHVFEAVLLCENI